MVFGQLEHTHMRISAEPDIVTYVPFHACICVYSVSIHVMCTTSMYACVHICANTHTHTHADIYVYESQHRVCMHE